MTPPPANNKKPTAGSRTTTPTPGRFEPVINLLRDYLLESDLVYGDETTVQVLKEPGRKAQTKSFMWARMNGTGPPVRLFACAPGRGGVHAEKLYAGIRPGTTLMTDSYERGPAAVATDAVIFLNAGHPLLRSTS